MEAIKEIITMWVLDGRPDTRSFHREDAALREDLQPKFSEPVNYSTVMGVYPKDAKTQNYYFQLN